MFLSLVATVILGYAIVLFSYRLLFHPLHTYPGPFLAKLSDGYAGFYSLCRNLHLKTLQDHLRYGVVMRYGPDRLVFNTPKAFLDIYRSERVTKSEVYSVYQQRKDVYSIFNARDKAIHLQKRKLIGRAVTEQSMRGFEPTMMEQIDIFLKQLLHASNDPSKGVVNMSERLKYLGYDIVGHLAFGYPLECQTQDRNHFIAKANAYGNYRLNVYMQWPLLRWSNLEFFFKLMPSSLWSRLMRLIETMISARLARPKDASRDLYYHVVDEMSAGDGDIRLGDLWPEAVFFIPAGGDTTSTALASLFFYLSRSPSCYRKLSDEIRATFKTGAEIRAGPQLATCHYLRACIDEALRMSPPVPGTLWRELADNSGEPWVIDGHVVPPGTKVGVNTYALHHNEECFSDSFLYKPERWLDGDTPDAHASKRAMQDAFAAFSTGPRGCAGKAMAYMEASLVMARTLWYFDFEVAPGEAGEGGSATRGNVGGRRRGDEFQTDDVFISMHDGPNLVFHPRENLFEELEA